MRDGLTLSRRHALAAWAAPVGNAAAQPQQAPLRLLCTGPAGSIPDVVARRYAERLGASLSRPVLVDNRPGAAGRIAVAALRQAPGDGSVLLLAQGAIVTSYRFLYATLGYDPQADLRLVAQAAEASLGLAVGPAVPAGIRDLSGLLVWLRANPTTASYGSPGVGTLPHLLAVLLLRDAGIEGQHVPYPGGPPAMLDLLAGRLAFLILPEGLLRPHREAGGIRVLATTAAGSDSFLPGVPSFADAGHARLMLREWFAFFAPGRSPDPVVAEHSRVLRMAAASPLLITALAEAGMTAGTGGTEETVARIAAETSFWAATIAGSGISVE